MGFLSEEEFVTAFITAQSSVPAALNGTPPLPASSQRISASANGGNEMSDLGSLYRQVTQFAVTINLLSFLLSKIYHIFMFASCYL